MVPKMPNRKYAYFRDDQIMFLVTHKADTVSPEQLEDFQTAITQFLGGRTIKEVPQAFSFPALELEDREQRLAELRDLETEARNTDRDQRRKELQELRELLSDRVGKNDPPELQKIKTSLKKDEDWQKLLDEVEKRESLLNEEGQIDTQDLPILFDRPFSLLLCELDSVLDDGGVPDALLETIRSLRSQFREELRDTTFGMMKVEDVSPNWLMSVSSQGGATGGPGAVPMPYDEEKDGPPCYDFAELRQDLRKAGLYDKDEGKDVDVAILDTSPSGHELVLAPKEWPDHPLLNTLLGLSGKLVPYPATPKALTRMASTSLNQHDYPMTNHGLFAAGIVHNIVPKATIHLIEVLNEFGVGDLASLADGLAFAYKKIYRPNSGRRLVVNCSWMLELPLSYLHCITPDEDAEYDFEQGVRRYIKDDDKYHALALRTICNNLALIGGQVVAAAGNDKGYTKMRVAKKLDKLIIHDLRDENVDEWIDYVLEYIRGGTPEARYPAAFVSVIGVGALPQGPKLDVNIEKYVSSNYSNLGDKPTGEAVMTLGGEEGRDPGNNNKNRGVLGLYLGEHFPRVIRKEMPGAPHKREIKMYQVKNKKDRWAWWAGTSFAAPILTGVIAAALGSGKRRTQEAFQALKATDLIVQAGTDALEDVMYVKQG